MVQLSLQHLEPLIIQHGAVNRLEKEREILHVEGLPLLLPDQQKDILPQRDQTIVTLRPVRRGIQEGYQHPLEEQPVQLSEGQEELMALPLEAVGLTELLLEVGGLMALLPEVVEAHTIRRALLPAAEGGQVPMVLLPEVADLPQGEALVEAREEGLAQEAV